MQFLKYIWLKQKIFLISIFFTLLLGVIFISWGLDVENQIIKNTILVSIGTSILASDIVALLDIINRSIQNQTFEHIDNIINKVGVDEIYLKRDLDEYDLLIDKAKNSIDITGYSLRGFYQSYKDILLTKVSENENLKIRILLVNPKSIHSKCREANEDGNANGVYDTHLAVMCNSFKGFKNISIRLLDYSLPHMIYRIDDTMFVGPYFYKTNSKSTNTTKLRASGQLFSLYQKEFDAMWEDSNPVPTDNK